MSSTNRGPIARWLYEGGPARLWQRRPAIPAIPAIPRSTWRQAGITALAAGAVGGAYVLWPRPLEQQLRLPPEAVRECIAGIAEVPTEYAARKLYRECLVAARDRIDFENRLPAWTEYNRQMREWAACIPTAGRSCPPEPQKPPTQG